MGAEQSNMAESNPTNYNLNWKKYNLGKPASYDTTTYNWNGPAAPLNWAAANGRTNSNVTKQDIDGVVQFIDGIDKLEEAFEKGEKEYFIRELKPLEGKERSEKYKELLIEKYKEAQYLVQINMAMVDPKYQDIVLESIVNFLLSVIPKETLEGFPELLREKQAYDAKPKVEPPPEFKEYVEESANFIEAFTGLMIGNTLEALDDTQSATNMKGGGFGTTFVRLLQILMIAQNLGIVQSQPLLHQQPFQPSSSMQQNTASPQDTGAQVASYVQPRGQVAVVRPEIQAGILATYNTNLMKKGVQDFLFEATPSDVKAVVEAIPKTIQQEFPEYQIFMTNLAVNKILQDLTVSGLKPIVSKEDVNHFRQGLNLVKDTNLKTRFINPTIMPISEETKIEIDKIVDNSVKEYETDLRSAFSDRNFEAFDAKYRKNFSKRMKELSEQKFDLDRPIQNQINKDIFSRGWVALVRQFQREFGLNTSKPLTDEQINEVIEKQIQSSIPKYKQELFIKIKSEEQQRLYNKQKNTERSNAVIAKYGKILSKPVEILPKVEGIANENYKITQVHILEEKVSMTKRFTNALKSLLSADSPDATIIDTVRLCIQSTTDPAEKYILNIPFENLELLKPLAVRSFLDKLTIQKVSQELQNTFQGVLNDPSNMVSLGEVGSLLNIPIGRGSDMTRQLFNIVRTRNRTKIIDIIIDAFNDYAKRFIAVAAEQLANTNGELQVRNASGKTVMTLDDTKALSQAMNSVNAALVVTSGNLSNKNLEEEFRTWVTTHRKGSKMEQLFEYTLSNAKAAGNAAGNILSDTTRLVGNTVKGVANVVEVGADATAIFAEVSDIVKNHLVSIIAWSIYGQFFLGGLQSGFVVGAASAASIGYTAANVFPNIQLGKHAIDGINIGLLLVLAVAQAYLKRRRPAAPARNNEETQRHINAAVARALQQRRNNRQPNAPAGNPPVVAAQVPPPVAQGQNNRAARLAAARAAAQAELERAERPRQGQAGGRHRKTARKHRGRTKQTRRRLVKKK